MAKKVLITGATGFIGRNLMEALKGVADYEILTANSKTPTDELVQKVKEADWIVHLGGVTRTTNTDLFRTGNSELTDKIISALEDAGRRTPVIFTSSIHADADNDYGVSKRFSEQRILAYGTSNNVPVYVFRLTNTFGKWARPNHHSVVATFCHNIAHGLDIHISDPFKTLNLLYIDDLVSCIRDIMESRENPLMIKNENFYSINKTYSVTLQELADIIKSFKTKKEEPSEEFNKRLYRTYLSYAN